MRAISQASSTDNPAITRDQIIEYSSKQHDGDKRYPIRRISYRDPENMAHRYTQNLDAYDFFLVA